MNYLVPIAPGADEGLVQGGVDDLDTNRNGDFYSHNDLEGGLAWLDLNK